MERPLLGLLPQVSKIFSPSMRQGFITCSAWMEPSNCGCFFYSTNLIYTPCSANVYKWQTSEKCSKDLRCSRLTLNRLKKPNHVWYWRKIAKLCLIPKKSPKVEQSWKDPGPATCLQNFPHTMFRNLHCRMLQNDPEKKKNIQNGWKSAICLCPKVDPNPPISM